MFIFQVYGMNRVIPTRFFGLIMEKTGPSLDVLLEQVDRKFSLKTVIEVALQMVSKWNLCLETVSTSSAPEKVL